MYLLTEASAVDFSTLDTSSVIPTVNGAFTAVMGIALTVAVIRKGYSIFMGLIRHA